MAKEATAADRDEFLALVDELEDIEIRRTGSGGFATTDDAARRQHVERRLIEYLSATIPEHERRQYVRLPCDLAVKVRNAEEQGDGLIADVGAGGAFVTTAVTATLGDGVEIEIERRRGSLEHSLRLRGRVAWVGAVDKGKMRGLGIAFDVSDDPSERRLRRFVIELLRQRPPA